MKFNRWWMGGLLALVSCSAWSASCNIVTPTLLAFGQYDPVTQVTPLLTQGTVEASCSPGQAPSLSPAMTMSAGASGNVLARQMVGPQDRLNYNLYTNSARTQIWGNGTQGTTVYVSLADINNGGNGRGRSYIPIYGAIAGSQPLVRPGAYRDTIVVTMTF